MRPAVFLDRDGTLCEEVHYLTRVEQLRLLPGVASALAELRAAGFALVVVTNQSAIARGILNEEQLAAIHREMERRLEAEGARLDGIYYCPHHPEAGQPPYRVACRCRKPGTEMLERASRDLGVDLARSYVVGDKLSDLTGAVGLGCRPILVRTGYGRVSEAELGPSAAVLVVEDLGEAAGAILGAGPNEPT